MKLSPNFSLEELTFSQVASRRGIDNTPSAKVKDNLERLALFLEQVRKVVNKPISISSGYRSKEVNESVGGSKTSQHCFGQAIDIDMDGTPNGVTNKMVFDFIKDKLPFDQLIWEFGTNENPDWVHCSYSDRNRKQVLKAIRNNGTQYKPY